MARKRRSKLQASKYDPSDQSLTAPDNKTSSAPDNSKASVRIEVLEPRVMFSADPLGLDLSEWAADTTLNDANDQVFWVDESEDTTELIFIDSSVPQRQLLIDDLQQQINNGRSAEIILLQPDDDGLDTITNAINQHESLSAIHIISHGSDQGIKIGDTWLTDDVAQDNATLLNQWQSALTDSADLLIYGCNLAASDEGLALLNTLATTTQADVAASIDTTGHNSLGANWTLEYNSGPIESDIHLSEAAKLNWEYELATMLDAQDDSLAPLALNTSLEFGDSQANADIDLTINDVIDPTIDEINLINVINPSNGSIVENTDDTFTFSPDNLGPARVDYIISDDTKDILHHWPLDSNGVAVDETFRAAGTIQGATVVTENNGSSYLEFKNGTPAANDEIYIPEIDLPDTFTLSFQFRLDGDSGQEQFVDLGAAFSQGFLASSPGSIGVWYDNSEIVTVIKGQTSNATFGDVHRTSVNQFNNDWHTYTLTIDSTTATPRAHIYLDGNLVGEREAGHGGFDANEFRLATFNDVFLSPLTEHHMRDVRIYDGVKDPTVNDLHEPVLYSDATANFTVVPTIDPIEKPDITLVVPPTLTVVEDSTFLLSSIADTIKVTHNSDPTAQLTVTVKVEHGTVAIAPGISGSDTNRLTITGTAVEVQDALNQIEYIAGDENPHYHGPDTLKINVDAQKLSDIEDAGWQQTGNTALPQNTRTLVDDPDRGEVLELRGGDYLIQNLPNTSQEISFSGWVNLDSVGPEGSELFNIRDNAGLRLDHVNGNGKNVGLVGFFRNEPAGDWLETYSTDNPVFLEGQGWKHVAYIIKDGYQGIYVDGVEVAKTHYSTYDILDGNGSPQPLINFDTGKEAIIGAHPNNTAYEFNGKIDDAAIHARALSVDEIQKLADEASPYAGETKNTNITVTPVNDKPVLSNSTNGNTQTGIDESDTRQNLVLEKDIEIDDIESGISGSFDQTILTLERSQEQLPSSQAFQAAGPNANDIYSSNMHDLTESNLIGQVNAFATVIKNSGGTLQFEFNEDATKDDIDELMRSITYSNLSQSPASFVKLTWTFDDQGFNNFGIQSNQPEISTITTEVRISPVNQDPEILTNETLLVESGTTKVITKAFLETTDPDHTASEVVYTLNSQPTAGTLLYDETGNGTFVSIGASDKFTQQDINSGRLKFEANNDPLGTTSSFRFIARDDIGGEVRDTFEIVLTKDTNDINDPPEGKDNTLTTNEDTPVILKSTDFGFSDPREGNSFAAVTVTTLPANGTLTLAGVPVTAAQLISITNINSGELAFTPLTNTNGQDYADFDFQVHDDGGTAGGGTDKDQTPNTITFDVNSVNDAPSGTDNTLSTIEDTSITLQAADFGFSDSTEGDFFAAVTVATPPANGTLTLAGVPVTASQTVSITDINNGDFAFTPLANANGTGHTNFDFQVHDNGGTANGGVDRDQSRNTITFDVTSVNDAPSGMDTTLTTNEDTSLTFQAADFGFSDSSDGDFFAAVTVTTLPANGTLLLSGVPVAAGQTISITDINDDDFFFTPLAGASGTNSANFDFQVHDNGGITNSGIDQDQSSNTITINIDNVNNEPSGADNTLVTNEDTAITLQATDFGFSDLTDGDFFAAITLTTLPANGTLALAGVLVTAGQTVSITNINSGDLVFTPLANANGVGYADLDFQVHDNGGTANGGIDQDQTPNTITFDINDINDAPTGTDKTLVANEDASVTFQAADFGFSDSIDGDFFAAVTIATLPVNGTLSLAGVAVTAGQTISISKINNGDLVFAPLSDGNGAGFNDFDFQVHDDGGIADGGIDQDQSPNTITLDVNNINDAPTGSDNTLTTKEDTSITLQGTDFGFSDSIDGDFFAAVTVTTLPANGTLSLADVPVISGQLINITDINNGDFVFTPLTDGNGSGYADFDFQVHDNGGTTDGGIDQDQSPNTITIDITNVNDAPNGTDNTLTANEDTSITLQGSDFGFSDSIDGDFFAAVTVTTLPANGTLSLDGDAVSSGQAISITNINNGDLVFTPIANGNGASYADFNFQVHDNGGIANGGLDQDQTPNTITFDINSVNDAPTGTSNILTTFEDSSTTLKSADFGFSDAIDGDAFNAVTITTIPANGTLTLANVSVSAGQTISISDINDGNLVFTPPADAEGPSYTHLNFTVQDDGGTQDGGIDQDQTPNRITFNIDNINDAPTASDNTLTANEDSILKFKESDFGFADPLDNNQFQSINIVSLPASGELKLLDNTVNSGQAFGASEVPNLSYHPPLNANGAAYTSFDFSVQDNGGLANGGQDVSQTPNTITINLNPVNDSPYSENKIISLPEDSSYDFNATDFAFNDVDNNELQSLEITELPSNGQLAFNGVNVNPGQIITAAQINLLSFTPEPDANRTGYDSFGFLIRDDGGISNGGNDTDVAQNFININVTDVNDAPSGADNTLNISEDTNYTFSNSDFGFSDDKDSNNLLSIIIDTLPTNGLLTHNGIPVIVGQTIAVNEAVTSTASQTSALQFIPTPNTSGSNYAFFDFRVQDDGGTSEDGVDTDPTANRVVINVLEINDAPSGTNNAVAMLEDTPFTFDADDFGFVDPDGDAFTSITLATIPTNGSLLLAGDPVIAGQVIPAVALDSLVYKPPANAQGNSQGNAFETFTFLVSDDGGTNNDGSNISALPSTIEFDIDPVNDAPVGKDITITTTEDTPYSFDFSDFEFTDIEDDNLSALIIDSLPGNGSLTLNGATVGAGQTIDLTNIGQLLYTPLPDQNGDPYDAFGFKLVDDGGTANNGNDTSASAYQAIISVTTINDPPSAEDNTISTLEDTAYIFSPADFKFSDASDSFASITVTEVPSGGSLTVSGITVVAGQPIPVADINASALQFTPDQNSFGSQQSQLKFLVTDDGGTLNGGIDTSTVANTLTINVDSVNDEPSGADFTASTPEDTPYTLSRTDFGFNDTDGNDFSAIVVVTLPEDGSLLWNNSAIAVDDVIPVSDIDAGQLVFVPDQNANGENQAQFSFAVVDDGGTNSGGNDTDQSPNNWSVGIDAINDEPSGTDSTLTINEDDTRIITLSDFGFSDNLDSDQLSAVVISTLPVGGSLMLSGQPVNSDQVISRTEISNNNLTYTPLINQNGSNFDEIGFQVRDDGGTANGGANTDQSENILTLNVLPVNDAPIANNTEIVIPEDGFHQLTLQDFIFSDTENDSLQSVRIDGLSSAGSLLLNGSAVGVDEEISASAISNGDLQFIPAQDFNGNTQIMFTVRDSGGRENQGADQDSTPNSLFITVTPVNDAPQGADVITTIADNLNYTLGIGDFEFEDTDNHSLLAVQIDSLPSPGMLTLAGQAVNAGEVIDIDSINQGLLVYVPAPNSGIPVSTFQYSVVDSGGVENDGQNTDPQSNDFSFNIEPVNDAPIANPDTLQVVEGQSVEQTIDNNSSLLANDIDADGDALTTELVLAPEHGEFELFANGTFRYTHNGSETLTDKIEYSVNDGLTTSVATVLINITPDNDAPIATRSIDNETIIVNEDFTLTLPGDHFTDPDDDTLEIVATLANGEPLPEWLTFDAATMTFTGSPPDGPELPELSIALTATDRLGLLARSEFTVTVVAPEPQFASAIIGESTSSAVENSIAEAEEVVTEEPLSDAESEQPAAEEEEEEIAFASTTDTTEAISELSLNSAAAGDLEVTNFSNQATVFRDFDLLARSIETHRSFSVNSLTPNDSFLNVQERRNLADLFYTEDAQVLNNNTNLLRQLNEQREQLQEGFTLSGNVVSGAVSVSTGLSLGYVIWLVRGGLLLGSVVSALPAWRNIDPLPILSTLGGDDGDDNDDSLEDLVETEEKAPKSEQGPDERQEN